MEDSRFGRISDDVLDNLSTIDDLIAMMKDKNTGLNMGKIGSTKDFKLRLTQFKQFLKDELPDFTEDEILKIDMNMSRINKIYDWFALRSMLIAMEFEARKNK